LAYGSVNSAGGGTSSNGSRERETVKEKGCSNHKKEEEGGTQWQIRVLLPDLPKMHGKSSSLSD